MMNLNIDEFLMEACVKSTIAGLTMANVEPRAVGCSILGARSQDITVVVGIVGRRSGTVTLNLPKPAALWLASRLLDSKFTELNEETMDAVGEITNIIAGKMKGELGSEKYGIANISCPSIIIGADYYMYHFQGFDTVTVEFELQNAPIVMMKDRIFSTTLALSRN